MESGGILFLNSSLIDIEVSRGDIDVVSIPANRVAEEMGSARSANMVMLGAFTRRSNLVSLDSVVKGLRTALKSRQKLIAINRQALTIGYEMV